MNQRQNTAITKIKDLDLFILDFLDLEDLQNISLVNKNLRNAAQKIFHKKICEPSSVNYLIFNLRDKLVGSFREYFRHQPQYQDLKQKIFKSPENITLDELVCFLLTRKAEDVESLEIIFANKKKFEKLIENISTSLENKKIKLNEKIENGDAIDHEREIARIEESYDSKIERFLNLFFKLMKYDLQNRQSQLVKTPVVNSWKANVFGANKLESKLFNFSGMNLNQFNGAGTYTPLDHIKFCYANFTDADLSEASLQYSDLSHATLLRTKLIGANLDGCLLIGARIQGANFTKVKLNNARFFTKEVVSNKELLNGELHRWQEEVRNLIGQPEVMVAIANDLVNLSKNLTSNAAYDFLQSAKNHELFSKGQNASPLISKLTSIFTKLNASAILDKEIEKLKSAVNVKSALRH